MNERRGTKGLELWCRKMTEGYPGVKIDNMTTSWRDGLAFCAIIHHFRPDLIEFSKLNKDDVYHNNELAFRVAEEYLGIPALLEPEDMVEYAVPDRLSILTYLSQFYQAFAVREGASAARIAPKRPQAPSDHGIVSPASTSPPTKVALLGAGKLRREPCAKCGLPVFIAERLNVGKSLFHRTCFRCARCNSQLTLANYYETENSKFCCEICPDEEKLATKASAQKAVLQRSMSDEEKTATLKSFSNEPDEFSALFESALENADIEKIQTLGKEFNSVRSDFFRSQIKSTESSDSGTEDKEEEPPDLPKSLPPVKDNSDSVISAQVDTINSTQNSKLISVNRTQDDSGFPKKDIVHSGLKVTLSFDQESQNVVTKDESFEESSLVKTRRRLFENDVTDIKADVNRKTVPLSTFTSIPSSINKSIDSSDINEDTPHSSHTPIKTNMWQPLSARNSPKKEIISSINKELNKSKLFNSQKHDVIAHSENEKLVETNTEDEHNDVSIKSTINSSTDNQSVVEISSDIISSTNESNSVVDSKSNLHTNSSVISIKDSTGPSVVEDKLNESINSNVIILDDTLDNYEAPATTAAEIIDDSMKSINESIEIMKSLEDSSISPKTSADSDKSKFDIIIDDSFKVSNLTVDSTEDTTNISNTSNVDQFLSIEDHTKEVETKVDCINENIKEIVEAVNDNVKETKSQEIAQAINPQIEISKPQTSIEIVETVNYNVKDPIDVSIKPCELIENVDAKPKKALLKMTSYPEDLNPFDDEAPAVNDSLNPFGSEDEEEEVSAPIKPTPSPRFKKKVLDASDLRKQSLMKVDLSRVSVNPFDDDDDDDEKPVPARRKKKISIPKISLNPFSSDDDDNESEEVAIRPVPARRQQRLSTDVKPRESLVNANLRFGSNSSISSESYYGSARKKRPAPRPPIPGLYGESTQSSRTSTPCQSVQHSPKATPKHRKNKKAPPPPPKLSSSPLPSPIKPDGNPTENPNDSSTKPDDLQQEKTAKDEVNRNRQSQDMQNDPDIEDSNLLSVPNKSTYGKWKRKKGQAPTKPIPQKRTIQCLPMAQIKKELEFIEVQQQGLEKQGVRLEQIIREKCEGKEEAVTNQDDDIPIEVEDLILQLFELVNEKNELFRKQTELMYLRRQQRLEEEHADVEYQIRCLMMQPEANKMDSDKAREEELIKRLVDLVERRNEIVECLEMDRVREAEEDDSISTHLNSFTLSRDADKSEADTSKKENHKDKKKQKKEKKSKHKDKSKLDIDKDVDTSENFSTLEKKKKKKFSLF